MDATDARDRIEMECRACGSRVVAFPAAGSRTPSGPERRECTVCPVCWAPGPCLEDLLASREGDGGPAGTTARSGRRGPADLTAAGAFGLTEGYRLLGCVRPDGPELEGEPREARELARMLWRLAGAGG